MGKAKILVVEDEALIAKDIQATLINLGYDVPAVSYSGEDALQKVEEYKPDLILMDIILKGDMDGIETANQVACRHDIPVIYLTAFADDVTLQRAKITEPFGYLLKPFEERELYITIEMALYKHTMEKKLKYLSLHDSLTNLYNRTFFEEEIRRLEKGRNFSHGLIICDVDGLKIVNDTMGHKAGDELLIKAANVISSCFRDDDIVSRVGGDEFAALLPNTTEESVLEACQRIKLSIETHNEQNPKSNLSISIGYAFTNNQKCTLTDLFKEADNNMYKEKLKRTKIPNKSIIQALVKAQESKDFRTAEHSHRVMRLMEQFAHALALSPDRIANLMILAQFHDIGKVGISNNILLKEDILNRDERNEMQRHCEIGYRFALSVSGIAHIAEWILKHHEWWNGEGYPLGIKGEEIPLECRILSIVDAYDTMIFDRAYKKAMTKSEAINELRKYSGKQFDPSLVDIFIKTLD